ncbi:VENN motif pre-toxin domain-containing protein [Yersinia ruckeri]|uniref:VENN motif pre-toxin domain-containing protein n=1 Tax=Yersinia ruckeri TaxID=29486 RepID=UPI001F1736DF|nr:VENN motif pre-toxin domain-containing protein [Yersinia ruckeri]UIN13643.1 VENN motif pre-toxin domain-containing protein [Yersinia ruckeri]
MKHHPELKGDAKALRETKEYQAAMQKYGTGSPLQQGLQAATAAIQGLAGGDMAKALAGASAPYLAEVIKKSTGNNQEANLMAHAVLGAVVAKINGDSALSGASGAAMGEYIAQQMYPGVKREDLSEEQRQTLSALSTLASGLSGGLAGDSTADAVAGAQAGKNAVENNYLSAKQIDAWSAEMKFCQAGGGDCSGIIKKYEELSTAQQQQLISDCAANPTTCQQKYGDVLADSLAVKQAIDRALGEDIPIKMVYDLTATWMHQMQVDGVIATNKVSEALQKEYGLDEVQAGIIASTAASAFGGISKAGKPNYTLNKDGSMLGINGPTVPSKTLWMGKGKERIDVENPAPGKRAGQIHYQDNSNNKYYYDPVTQTFPEAPKSVNDKLKDPAFKNAIDKGMTKYLGEK